MGYIINGKENIKIIHKIKLIVNISYKCKINNFTSSKNITPVYNHI
jgi:hypothetical protein